MKWKKASFWNGLTRKKDPDPRNIRPGVSPGAGIANRFVQGIRRWTGNLKMPWGKSWTSPDRSYAYAVDLPGTAREDISLELVRGSIVLRAENRRAFREERNGLHILEQSWGVFQRKIPLPGDADEKKIRARYKNGVLTISVPRKKQKNSRTGRIRINYA